MKYIKNYKLFNRVEILQSRIFESIETEMDVSNNESLPIFVLDPYSGCVRGENREIIGEFYDND